VTAAVDAPWLDRCDLGEGPYWDAATARLVYVDIDAGTLHRLDPVTGTDRVARLPPPVSFAIPVDGRTGSVCGSRTGPTLLDEDDHPTASRPVEPERQDRRLNDGKADPRGRLWFGSMSLQRTPGDGAFYRLDASGLTTVIDAVTTSNGLDWDVERRRMYYVDSPTQRIDVFNYDVATGAVEDRRTFAEIDPADGFADGLALDADGFVWVALFRGGAVRRYDPGGAVAAHVPLPTSCPTCPVFGGADLATMFVTTSRHRLSVEQRAAEPLAGALLVVDAGVRGRAGNAVSSATAAAIGSEG